MGGPMDTGQAAIRALRHLTLLTDAKTFAQVDPDAVFDYGTETPWMNQEGEGVTVIRWPDIEMLESNPSPAEPMGGMPGPIFMVGRRPSLNLYSFSEDLGARMRRWGIRYMLHLTSGFAHAAHTLPVRVGMSGMIPGSKDDSGQADELREILERAGHDGRSLPLQDAAMAHACLTNGVGYIAMCGHCPGYLNQGVNQQVAAEMARRVMAAAQVKGKTEQIDEAEREYLKQVNGQMESNPHFRAAVDISQEQARRLDENASLLPPGESEAVASDLEEFLKKERDRNGN